MWWSHTGAQLFLQFEEGSISIFSFARPARRKVSPGGALSARQRLMASALAAVSVPAPR